MKSTEILKRIQIQHLLTSLAVDSLARTSVLLEKVSELSVKEAAYGLKCIVCVIGMSQYDYEELIREKVFIRDGKSVDSAGVINTTNTFVEDD